jgi:molecular chaperone HtpG
VQKALGDKAKEVRFSHRLTDSPACLVLETQDMAVHLQRVLRQAGHEIPVSRPILELNPQHALVRQLETETDEPRFTDWSHVLFDQAMLAEGGQLDDPAGFVERLNALLMKLAGKA